MKHINIVFSTLSYLQILKDTCWKKYTGHFMGLKLIIMIITICQILFIPNLIVSMWRRTMDKYTAILHASGSFNVRRRKSRGGDYIDLRYVFLFMGPYMVAHKGYS